VIGNVAGPSEAGTYTAIERIVSAASNGCMLTHAVAYPNLAKAYHRDRQMYRRLIRDVLLAMLALAIAVAVALWWTQDLANRLLFGGRLAGSEQVLAWSLAWMVLSVVGLALTGYLTVSGRGSQVVWVTARVLIVSAAVGLPASAMYGAAGWMASLALGQLLVVHAAYVCWRSENGG
jgi:O-antigen/teichoic acid export membrane protein